MNQHWIGYDNLGRNATDFRYSFSGEFSMIQGLSFSGLNASDASTSYDENCVAFVNSNMTSHAGYIDDRQCKSQYSFICEKIEPSILVGRMRNIVLNSVVGCQRRGTE